MKQKTQTERSAKELAYLYDLYIAPVWREVFDRLVDEEITVPQEGKILDAGCGTGGYAVDLSAKLGAKAEVVGVDASDERLELARAKAAVQHVKHVNFAKGTLGALEQADNDFDLVIGDASMLEPEQIGDAFAELTRVAKPGATIALKLATRGSFDEFFSIYWEALHDLNLEAYTPQLEGLITKRPTVTQAEQLARDAGLKQVRSVTRKERFDFSDAAAFLTAPLIESSFLNHWLEILPNAQSAEQAREAVAVIIDRERQEMDFDVSIKATLIIGQK
jgi:ubiquinone/menaquinone biosynthesis C-methylase UbiE